ncbi:hypothetical protein PACTADRAFT_54642 [Pachysolen tannophilus NRRL Y-2460]|uniref:Hydantoinase/oxoprolinase N-terminal domain-containing protein n=1 Tax=Pachysolen tannophilus NRRL Y-2460 TaxID=669874 RepID=A0A1E4TYA5_PACTA|nr:hypothetical protein PACTADRAFT_54642 [Pachysolen tannophilus NRRL Y-2460]
MISDNYLIGIDVGGTNTDSVLINPNSTENVEVLAWNKSVTTPDVSDGIERALSKLFDAEEHKHTARKENVISVTIGTTHFINAIIEQDRSRLDRVAVIRLCGPYSVNIPPFSDFAEGLSLIIRGYEGYVDGGHRVDGSEIRKLNEDQIIEHCQKIKKLGITSVSVVGIFANIVPDHEERAKKIIIRELGENVNVVMSHQVSGIGYIERENASILNASIMNFSKKIIHSFLSGIKNFGLICPVFLTQNNGTILTVEDVLQTPIRTFCSGATNSMRGASFLCSSVSQKEQATSVLVADIGGTTLDMGMLLPSGFPRLSSSYSTVGGVRMNFSMPFVESIGLGGGSIIRTDAKTGELTIGPDSVGAEIVTKSIVFGGNITTATDISVSVSRDKSVLAIGDNKLVQNKFGTETINEYKKLLVSKIERVIDRIRTSPEPLPLILVGGGSFIVPSEDLKIEGASTVVRPPFYQVANAIGAAMGKLSADVQHVQIARNSTERESILEELKAKCIEKVIEKGALRESIDIIDVHYDPVPYIENTYTFEAKVVGDVDYEKIASVFHKQQVMNQTYKMTGTPNEIHKDSAFQKNTNVSYKDEEIFDHVNYKPFINSNREWIVSETDLDYLNVGCYILGCGGGGNPYPSYMEVKLKVRNGEKIRIIHLEDAFKNSSLGEGSFVNVGFAGSPTVANEQLSGTEMVESISILSKYMKQKIDGVFNWEIGGGNGFQSLWCGLDSNCGLPVIDCDLMGRAYPLLCQTSPVIFNDNTYLTPCGISDGNGNKLIISDSGSDLLMEKVLRAALSEIGAHVGHAQKPMPHKDLLSMSVRHSLSLAWRIGKAVFTARAKSEIDLLPKRILDAIGGDGKVGRVIFQGKIIELEKKLFKGHIYGEVTIENENNDKLKIPFKNENISAELQTNGNSNCEVICCVPDLISVCDKDTGEAVGTPDYRYGLHVFVIAFAPNSIWNTTPKAIEIGGPKSFGPIFEKMSYTPIGEYVPPISVIDEYSSV